MYVISFHQLQLTENKKNGQFVIRDSWGVNNTKLKDRGEFARNLNPRGVFVIWLWFIIQTLFLRSILHIQFIYLFIYLFLCSYQKTLDPFIIVWLNFTLIVNLPQPNSFIWAWRQLWIKYDTNKEITVLVLFGIFLLDTFWLNQILHFDHNYQSYVFL